MAISAWIQQRRSLIFLFIILAALLPILLQIAWPFFTAFIIASIVAIIMNPAKEWLSARIHRPGLATFLITIATASLLGIFLAIAGFTITSEVTDMYNEYSQSAPEEGGWLALAATAADRFVNVVAARLPIDKEAIRAELMNSAKSVSGYLISNIGIAVGQVTNFLITGFLVTIFLYFLLRYGKDWINRLAALTPLDPGASDNIIKTIRDSVIANVNGMLAVALGQGLLLILGLWLVGVRSPIFWGSLGGLASIIPVIGGFLVWGPIAIGLLIMGAYWKALILVLWCIFLAGSADNVLRPLVVGMREKQHPMLVALAAVGGTYAFGALGILLGPLMVSLTAALLKEIQLLVSENKTTEEKAQSNVTVEAGVQTEVRVSF